MEKFPNRIEQNKEEVTISSEIKESLTPEELAEYRKIKIELRDILTVKGIWSSEFDVWMDANIDRISFLGKSLEAVGKWMKRKPSHTKKEQLVWYRSLAHKALKGAKGTEAWFPALEKWIDEGPAETLIQAGELMDTVGNSVSSSISALEMVKEMREKGLL